MGAKANDDAAAAKPAPNSPHHPRETLGMIRLDQIAAGINYRKTFRDSSIAELAASIRQHGVLQPPIVRPLGGDVAFVGGKWIGVTGWQLIAGERRVRACRAAGLTEVLCKVRPLSDADLFEIRAIQLGENDSEPVPPSEEAAAYREMVAGGRSLDAIADATGKPRAFVRSVLAAARCPAWLLACVDRGVVTRTAAEVVGRVPGEASRERAAGCVLLGLRNPAQLDRGAWNDAEDWREACESIAGGGPPAEPLTSREARELIREHFTVQLKGAPFSLKVVDLVPEAGSCEACPRRAGNDDEARAEGTRPDVCLDPDCYRRKVEAYRAAEIAKAEAKGVAFSGLDDVGHPAPRGWAHPHLPPWHSDLTADFPVGAKRRDEPLKDLLGKADCPRWLAFGRDEKPLQLVKVAEARGALRDAGVIAKEKRPEAEPKPVAPAPAGKAPAGPSESAVSERAAEIAGRILAEFGAENFDDLDVIEEHTGRHPNTSAVWEAFRFVARHLIRDHIAFGHERGAVVERSLGMEPKSTLGRSGVADAEKKMAALGHRETLALCVRLAAECEFQAAPAGPFGTELLAWAELDWGQLRDQARRELAGGETAAEKVARAEAGQEAVPKLDLPEPTAKPKKKAKAS